MGKTGVGATWGRSESNWRLDLSRPRTFGRRSKVTVRSAVPAIPGGNSFNPRHCHPPDVSDSSTNDCLLAQGRGGLNMTNRPQTGPLQEHVACREKPKKNPQCAVAWRFVVRNPRLVNSSNTTRHLRTSIFLPAKRGLRLAEVSLPETGLASRQHPQKCKVFRDQWQISD